MSKQKKAIVIAISSIIIALFISVAVYFGIIKLKSNKIEELIQNYEPPILQESLASHYDVIVIGGEPEGVAAAVSSARNGAKTLLIEEREELGGLMTYGMLNFIDFPEGKDGKGASQGIFKEWHKLVGGYSAFDITAAKAAFYRLVSGEENLTLSIATKVVEPIMQDGTVIGAVVENPLFSTSVTADRLIDATQDADFAAAAGVPFFVGNSDISPSQAKMSVTLMIHLNDVDWNNVKKAISNKTFGVGHIQTPPFWISEQLPAVAWGFTELTQKYVPYHENTRLRGLNLVKIGNDYYINALQIFDIDGLSKDDKQRAIEIGKAETDHIVEYLSDNFPGFENAKVASYPTELYVRETRHILAEYQLKGSDLWENRDHWDSIAYGGYPIDIQAQSPHDYGYVTAYPTQYGIPYRSLVPLHVDGLLVVGRSAGFSSIAAGSARVIPTGMATGEAAGAAAVISIEHDVTFRELSNDEELIKLLRQTLSDQGALITNLNLSYEYENTWFYPNVKELINFGIVSGGYENDLAVDEQANKYRFINALTNIMKKSNNSIQSKYAKEINHLAIYRYNEENEPLTRDLAAKILVELLQLNATTTDWEQLQQANIADQTLSEKLAENRALTNSEMYYLLGSLLHELIGAYEEHLHTEILPKYQ